MTKTKQTTKTYAVPAEVTFVYALITLAVLLIGLYMYFLSASIMHVVMRTEVEHAISTVTTEISHFESELMLAHHRVSAEVATLEGYVEPAERFFIDRSSQQNLVLGSAATNQ